MLKRIAVLLFCMLVGFCIGKTQMYFEDKAKVQLNSL